MSRRVMIHVQHLLGVGHLKRMVLLAGALAARGAEVTLVSGGMPAHHLPVAAGVHFRQLPPVRAKDQRFSGLVDAEGRDIDDRFRNARRDALLSLFEAVQPDVLIVELFPLGRRQLRFELLPLLEQAAEVCGTVACSVRDIVNRRPHREAEALDWLNRYFGMLLVHGDERWTPIADSVPGIARFEGQVIHTGYIAEPLPPAGGSTDEVLVSAGGGAAGARLFGAAAEASRILPPGTAGTWRFRHSPETPDRQLAVWRAAAAPGSVFEPVAPDFRARLGRAALSVSQLGYNTAVDLIQSGVRAVVAPYEGEGETEQVRRASALAPLGFHVVPESALDGPALAEAVRAAMASPAPARPGRIDLEGLDRSASCLLADR